MPLIDMAEAVSRGDIIVDEVDALNAVNSGKLSEIETARFSPLVAEHSRRQSSGNGRAEPLLSTDSDELGDGSGAAASDDERAWANVLVDEVDFVHAAEQGRINRNDLHLMERRSSAVSSVSQHLLDDSTNGSQEENGWNRVLVDEVDILHAAQGAGIVNRSDCHLGHMHREVEIARSDRTGDLIHRANSRSGDNAIELERTNAGRGRDKH